MQKVEKLIKLMNKTLSMEETVSIIGHVLFQRPLYTLRNKHLGSIILNLSYFGYNVCNRNLQIEFLKTRLREKFIAKNTTFVKAPHIFIYELVNRLNY